MGGYTKFTPVAIGKSSANGGIFNGHMDGLDLTSQVQVFQLEAIHSGDTKYD